MKIIDSRKLEDTRVVKPSVGVISNRIIIADDGVGYSLNRTIVGPGKHSWHYKHHIETCYCVSGSGFIKNENTGDEHLIEEGVAYCLDKNEPHTFKCENVVELICVFNPPLAGNEVHQEDGSYPASKESPVYRVKAVPIDKVTANDYNPNAVAPPEMELLETSIWEDGYTQPVVVVYDSENDSYVVVDGFHRYCTLRDSKRIREREKGMLPVVVLEKEMHDRMASTIRHNRARGSHNIELMSSIVAELVEMGKGDAWICKHIGMSKDELLRLKQITGVAALFANQDFSKSWDAEDFEEAMIDEKNFSPC